MKKGYAILLSIASGILMMAFLSFLYSFLVKLFGLDPTKVPYDWFIPAVSCFTVIYCYFYIFRPKDSDEINFERTVEASRLTKEEINLLNETLTNISNEKRLKKVKRVVEINEELKKIEKYDHRKFSQKMKILENLEVAARENRWGMEAEKRIRSLLKNDF